MHSKTRVGIFSVTINYEESWKGGRWKVEERKPRCEMLTERHHVEVGGS